MPIGSRWIAGRCCRGSRRPSLVVRGELSPILPADMAARLGASIRGAEVAEIKGAYHHLTLDAPDAFAAVLDRFLRAVM